MEYNLMLPHMILILLFHTHLQYKLLIFVFLLFASLFNILINFITNIIVMLLKIYLAN